MDVKKKKVAGLRNTESLRQHTKRYLFLVVIFLSLSIYKKT